MTKWIMPHEDTPVELTTPQKASPRYIMPHELEAKVEKVATPYETALAEETKLRRGLIGAGQVASDIIRGGKQAAGMILGNEWSQQVSDELKAEQGARAAIAKDPYSSTGKLAANVAMGLVTPITKYPKTASALYGAALEGPLKAREDATFGDMLTGAGEGALGGFAGGALGQALTSGVARSKNAYKGRFANLEDQNRLRIFKENRKIQRYHQLF